jgi:hypothetical protein
VFQWFIVFLTDCIIQERADEWFSLVNRGRRWELPHCSVEFHQFLAKDPEVQVRLPALPDFLRSIGSGTGSTQPRGYNSVATWKKFENTILGFHWADHATPLYQQKLTLTSTRNGGCSVGEFSRWLRPRNFFYIPSFHFFLCFSFLNFSRSLLQLLPPIFFILRLFVLCVPRTPLQS